MSSSDCCGGDSCGCGSACKCQSGCKMNPGNTTTGVVPNKSCCEMGGSTTPNQNKGGAIPASTATSKLHDACKCGGGNCTCNPCTCK